MKALIISFALLFLFSCEDKINEPLPDSIAPINYLNPADKSDTVFVAPTLKWDVSAQYRAGTLFNVYLDTLPEPGLFKERHSFNFLRLDSLIFNKTYYWKIIAILEDGTAIAGKIKSFKTEPRNKPPNYIVYKAPANNSEGHTLQVDFSWECSDPEGDSLTYDLYISDNYYQLTLFAGNLQQSNFSADLSQSFYYGSGKTFYWQIVAKDGKNNIRKGAIQNFRLNYQPDQPTIISPGKGESVVPLNPTLKWECSDPDGDSLTYDIYFGTAQPFDLLVSGTQSTSIEVGPLLPFTLYFWNVVARDDKGNVSSTENVTFQTMGDQPVTIKEIEVNGGTFSMGCTSGDTSCTSEELPVHDVTVSSFYISKYEITNSKWEAVTGLRPTYFWGDDLPFVIINVSDIARFCNALSILNDLEPCYTIKDYFDVTCNWDANGYRMPTEAEWEFAARGGNLSNGYIYSGSNILEVVAWYSANGDSTIWNIGSKYPNELGIYDMSGNLPEQCWDYYGPYSSEPQIDPRGPSTGKYRVIRGGGYKHLPEDNRVSARLVWSSDTYFLTGVRIVRNK